MNTLFIDTHLYDINIILFKDQEIICEKSIIGKKNNSSLLIPTLQEVLDNKKIDEIIVVNGPGSFTGVRIGVTVAKTLAYTKNIPIKSISYLDLMAISLSDGFSVVALSDQNGYFIGEYENYKLISDYKYIKMSEIKKYDGYNKMITNVTIDFKKMFKAIKNIEYQNPHLVNPVYVKLISVENDKKN